MREERIEVTITPEGNTMIEVKGVKGKRCLDLTQDLEEELGIVTERRETKEMRERPARITTKRKQRLHRS